MRTNSSVRFFLIKRMGHSSACAFALVMLRSDQKILRVPCALCGYIQPFSWAFELHWCHATLLLYRLRAFRRLRIVAGISE
jgi:hypothetical protein